MSGGRKQASQHSWGPWLGGSSGFIHLTLDLISLVSGTSGCQQSLKVCEDGRGNWEAGLPKHIDYVELNIVFYMALLPLPFIQAQQQVLLLRAGRTAHLCLLQRA